MSFTSERDARVERIEARLKKYLPRERGYQKTVIEAMNYSVLAGGKRLRPMLMLETCRLFGGEEALLEPFMAAIEMIHTYSLVHDDLPAMDNDEYRRGRKTTHAVYGEAMGILAGDGLLNYAFETALQAFDLIDAKELDAGAQYARVARAAQILAGKAGIYGMIGGQTADVEAVGREIDEALLSFIFELKTGALIEASMMVGAVIGGADDAQIACVEQIASKIGRAFQIQDDVLDVVGTTEELGKPVHSDEKNNKPTYVTMHGLAQAQADVERLSGEAMELLEKLQTQVAAADCGKDTFLTQLLASLVTRKK